MEARVGIEPTHKAFAEPCLTTWLPRRLSVRKLNQFLPRASQFSLPPCSPTTSAVSFGSAEPLASPIPTAAFSFAHDRRARQPALAP